MSLHHQGFRASSSGVFKIRLNSIANGIEGGVKTYGNTLGVLSFMYTVTYALGETMGVDRLLPQQYADDIVPVLSAVSSSCCYCRRRCFLLLLLELSHRG